MQLCRCQTTRLPARFPMHLSREEYSVPYMLHQSDERRRRRYESKPSSTSVIRSLCFAPAALASDVIKAGPSSGVVFVECQNVHNPRDSTLAFALVRLIASSPRGGSPSPVPCPLASAHTLHSIDRRSRWARSAARATGLSQLARRRCLLDLHNVDMPTRALTCLSSCYTALLLHLLMLWRVRT